MEAIQYGLKPPLPPLLLFIIPLAPWPPIIIVRRPAICMNALPYAIFPEPPLGT